MRLPQDILQQWTGRLRAHSRVWRLGIGFHQDVRPAFGHKLKKFLLPQVLSPASQTQPFALQCSLLTALWGILLAPWLENTGVPQDKKIGKQNRKQIAGKGLFATVHADISQHPA